MVTDEPCSSMVRARGRWSTTWPAGAALALGSTFGSNCSCRSTFFAWASVCPMTYGTAKVVGVSSRFMRFIAP